MLQNSRACRGGASPRQPRPASVHTRCDNPSRVDPTEAGSRRAGPVHPPSPALTPARTREASAVPARLPSAPKCSGLTRTPGQARAFTIVPRRGRESILSRPKATESSEPSTSRRSCSSPAVSSPGKPGDDSTARAGPRPHSRCRSSIDGHPRATLSRGNERRSRAQPLENPEGPPRGLATRAVGAKTDVRDGEHHRGGAHCRQRVQPKSVSRLLRPSPAETVDERNTYTSADGNHPRATTRSTRRSVQRAASYLLTRLQKQPVRAGRLTSSEDEAGRVTRLRRLTPASTRDNGISSVAWLHR